MASNISNSGGTETRATSWDDFYENDDDSFYYPSLAQVDETKSHQVVSSDIDKMLANEMTKLSLQEREQALHDLHGVADLIEETPEFCTMQLEALKNELLVLPNKDSYETAKQQNPSHVDSSDFGLLFLRANSFDARIAAKQIIMYFDRKQELFGKDKLGKTITYADLSEDDRFVLKTGLFQVLPSRDRAGRAVVFVTPAFRQFKDVMNVLRAFWYFNMSIMEHDVDTQQRGLVVILFDVGGTVRLFDTLIPKIGNIEKALPTRLSGLHFCYDDMKLRAIMALITLFAGADTRKRMRSHYGTSAECQFALLTFGIPKHALPFSGNDVSLENHLEWIQCRQNIENSRIKCIEENTKNQSDSVHHQTEMIGSGAPCDGINLGFDNNNVDDTASDRISLPRKYDVLFGKGKTIQSHPGNVRFHHLIESYAEQYESVRKFEKTTIAETIVTVILDGSLGGRFLKWNAVGGYWEAVDRNVARNKVSHAFRTRRAALSGKVRADRKQRRRRRKMVPGDQEELGDSGDNYSSGDGTGSISSGTSYSEVEEKIMNSRKRQQIIPNN